MSGKGNTRCRLNKSRTSKGKEQNKTERHKETSGNSSTTQAEHRAAEKNINSWLLQTFSRLRLGAERWGWKTPSPRVEKGVTGEYGKLCRGLQSFLRQSDALQAVSRRSGLEK